MRKILIPIGFILLGVVFSSIYVVEESTKSIVLRFNKIIGLSEPGLHFKIPMIDKVRLIDAKIQTTNSRNSTGREQKFITREKKDLIVDYFVQWKITDFNRLYETISGGNSIENLLLARLNGRLRAEIGKLDIKDIINDSNLDTNSRNSLMVRVKDALNGVQQSSNDIDNKPIDQLIEEASSNPESVTSMKVFGVEVVDVRIKQINFPAEVSESIYARMSAEREEVARDQRYQGIREADEIRASATLEANKILSEAEKKSRTLRGNGDATAAKLYAEAFNKDLSFFSFIRSLKAYEASFNSSDVMVISPDSEFFRYMKLQPKN